MNGPLRQYCDGSDVYVIHPDHRNRSPEKSQWSIDPPREFQVFQCSKQRGWLSRGSSGWGLHIPNGSPEILGVAVDHRTPVFVAKFVRDPSFAQWHGYPASHQDRSGDVPDHDVLADWERSGLLGPAKVRKILRGQPCRL